MLYKSLKLWSFKMKNAKKGLGFAVIAAIALNVLLITGCPDTPDTTQYSPPPEETPFVPPPPIEMPLIANRWGQEGGYRGHQWESAFLKLSDYTRITPKRGDVLQLKISGSASTELKSIVVQLFQAHNVLDDNDRKYLSNSRTPQNLGTSFTNASFDIFISSDINRIDGDVYVQVVNMLWQIDPDDRIVYGNEANKLPPEAVSLITVMANISNFTMSVGTTTIETALTEEERWGYWSTADSSANLDHFSIDSDNVVTATVSGTPEKQGVDYTWRAWTVSLQYFYTAKTNTSYTYKFMARTDLGTRKMNVQYFTDNDTETYIGKEVEVIPAWQEFTIKGNAIPKAGVQEIAFQLANVIGTVHIKMLEIVESNDVPKTITVTGIPAEAVHAVLRVHNDLGEVVASSWGNMLGGSVVSFNLHDETPEEEPWYESGSYYLSLDLAIGGDDNWGYWYWYTNGQKFPGTDIYIGEKYSITSATSTIAFSKFKSEVGFEGMFGGTGPVPPPPPIGEISGTITLTNVPNPAPQVRILVSGGNGVSWWNGSNYIDLSSGNYTNLSWSIPLRGENGFSSSDNVYFYLDIEPVGGGNEFSIGIPTPTTISSANQSGIALGSVSIKSITLSGTINVTLDGQQVPNVRINAYGGWVGWVDLSPAASASWSITMGAPSSAEDVYFDVLGYDANWNYLFGRSVASPVQIDNSTTSITGIVLNIGNIANPFVPVNPSSLTANTWKDGEISNYEDVDWYSISVTNGTTYYLWWNDFSQGDNTKTLYINVSALYSSTNLIFSNSERAWYTPVSFTASSTGTVFIKVHGYGTGTYAIAYNTTGIKP
jgi:hypothetical protein